MVEEVLELVEDVLIELEVELVLVVNVIDVELLVEEVEALVEMDVD